MNNDTTNPPFHFKYKGEIAQDLGISLSTLKRWLIKHEIKIPRGYVSPEHQIIIHNKFKPTQHTDLNFCEPK